MYGKFVYITGENEGDETGGAYDEEGLELSESDEGLFHIPGLDPDSDDFLMIEYSDPEAPPQLGPWTANATFPLSFSIFEDPTTLHADSTGKFGIFIGVVCGQNCIIFIMFCEDCRFYQYCVVI